MMKDIAISLAIAVANALAPANEVAHVDPIEVEPASALTLEDPAPPPRISKSELATFTEEADAFFKKYVKNGKVDYKGVKSNKQELSKLIDFISSPPGFGGYSKNQQLAFYINSYNLWVIQGVINNHPLKSPLDVEGFFDKTKYNLAGKQITLNHLENVIIRPTFKDPRIHFVLVCAANGCPPIISEAYTSEKLNQQLDRQTRKALTNTTFVQVKSGEKKVLLSEIFKWYRVDFPEGDKALIDYLNKYRTKAIPNDYAVGFYSYDWQLNEL